MIFAPGFLWLVVLACFACGCGSMRTARWPDAPTDPGAGDPGMPVVAIGDYVVVDRLDGTRVKGNLRALTDESVTVEVDRGLGRSPRLQQQAIPRAEIGSVSKEATSVGRSLLLIGGLVVGIVGIAVASGPVGPTSYDF
jgi:hypothetical protein